MAEEVFDFTGDTKESMDLFFPPPGWYLATLRSVKQGDKDRHITFSYRVDGPGMKGATVMHRLNIPRLCENNDWLDAQQKAWKVSADRIIFQGKSPFGQKVTGSFETAIGRQFVINVKDASYPDKNTGKIVDKVDLDYAPYPLDHDGIPPAVRVHLGLALLPGQELPKEGLPKGPTKRKAKTDDAAPMPPAGGDNAKATDAVLGSLGL